MLTESDIKALNTPSHKLFSLGKYVFVIMIVLFGFGAGYNLYLAVHYANLYGLDFSGMINLWNEEPTLERMYSGYEHLSLHKLNMAILNFGVTIIFLIQLKTFISKRKKNKKILSVLVKHGEISEAQINA